MTAVGIDLGTSHSSLATFTGEGPDARAELLDIPQLSGPHDVTKAKLLPSVYFHNHEYTDLRLPWQENPPIIGLWARDLAITSPDRAISSAKSWLCYKGEQRLPPGASWTGLSAKEVSALYLSHLLSAWEERTGRSRGDIDNLVLTVPASFDPLARELTEEAARDAGLTEPLLLEEPLAAFYAWLAAHADWNKRLKAGDSILVCDVGGGTSDFSLIAVKEGEGGTLELDRIAVGKHLLLGGDNMDLALAHSLAAAHPNLDHWQFVSLQREVRRAKEHLLAAGAEASYPLSVAGRGSSLFAQALRIDVQRHAVEELIRDGFFPVCDADATLKRSIGLQAAGLPYEADPAITKHLAAFLRTAAKAKGDGQKIFAPTHGLFNRCVFKAKALEERVL